MSNKRSACLEEKIILENRWGTVWEINNRTWNSLLLRAKHVWNVNKFWDSLWSYEKKVLRKFDVVKNFICYVILGWACAGIPLMLVNLEACIVYSLVVLERLHTRCSNLHKHMSVCLKVEGKLIWNSVTWLWLNVCNLSKCCKLWITGVLTGK